MKNIYTLIGSVLLFGSLQAQVTDRNIEAESAPVVRKANDGQPTATMNRANRSANVLWTNDFTNTTDWIYTGGTGEFTITDQLSATLVSQNFDQALMSTSGGNFAFIDSDGAGQSATQNAFIYYNGHIDLSGYNSVKLRFENYHRRYQETHNLLISTDSVNWTTIEVNADYATNTTSANPEQVSIDISAYAANSSTVYIGFNYVGAYDWFWCIDDVEIIEGPAYDVALNDDFYFGVDSTAGNYYSMMPVRHADNDTVIFGAMIENLGSADMTNTIVDVDVMKDGNAFWNEQSTPITSVSLMEDSIEINTEFRTNGLGVYDITFSVEGDSVDAEPNNNTLSHTVEVSLNEYRWDNDQVTSGNWYNATTNVWEMAVSYKINVADTVTGISVMFPDLTNDYGIDAGDPLSYYLYDADLNMIASNEFYIVTADDEDSWVTLPVYAEIEPGFYYAAFKVYTAETAVASNGALNANVSPFSVLVNVDEASQWSYTTSLLPFVRLLTKNDEVCNNVIVSGTGTVVDNQPTGSIDFTPTGGTNPYSFSWTGPNNFTSTDQNLSGLATQGTYTVVVTDLNGCVSDPIDFTVAGIVTVDELSLNEKVSVYPNPNQGEFVLALEGLNKDTYSIRVMNIIGQEVLNQKTNLSGDSNIRLNGFEEGVYFVEVSNENSSTIVKVVVQ